MILIDKSGTLLSYDNTSLPSEIESQILDFYNSLSEKDHRRYAAIEVTKLGYGGATYISSILRCDDRTITRGVNDLNSGLSNEGSRICQSSAGQIYYALKFLQISRKKVIK